MRAILTYHSLDDSGSAISVSPTAFRAHAEWLARSSVEVVGLADLLRTPPETNAVALTFDDAFANFTTVAEPILREYGWPATVFAVPGYVGQNNAWGGVEVKGIPTLPLMGWDALARLAASGIEVAPHTMHHVDLTQVDDTVLETELTEGCAALRNRLPTDCRSFAYPYGALDARVKEATGRHFDLAVSTRFDVLGTTPDPLDLPRLDAFYFRDARMLEAWGTPRFLRLVQWRRALRGIKRRVKGTG